MESYAKTVGGKLKLKGIGDVDLVKKKKKHTKKHKRDDVVSGGGAGDGRPDDTTEEPAGEAEVDAVRVKGTGRITSSGTVIHGLGTKFMHEFKPGDGLEISHPTSLQDETRVVKAIVSDTSLSISSAFSTDLVSSTDYHCLQLPRKVVTDRDREVESKKRKVDEEKSAFGTYASNMGEQFTYRVKKAGAYGGYEVITEKTGQAKTRQELLDMRSKKKADRHCM